MFQRFNWCGVQRVKSETIKFFSSQNIINIKTFSFLFY
jgi:hypothetical protein